jgi:hypothetical protein
MAYSVYAAFVCAAFVSHVVIVVVVVRIGVVVLVVVVGGGDIVVIGFVVGAVPPLSSRSIISCPLVLPSRCSRRPSATSVPHAPCPASPTLTCGTRCLQLQLQRQTARLARANEAGESHLSRIDLLEAQLRRLDASSSSSSSLAAAPSAGGNAGLSGAFYAPTYVCARVCVLLSLTHSLTNAHSQALSLAHSVAQWSSDSVTQSKLRSYSCLPNEFSLQPLAAAPVL